MIIRNERTYQEIRSTKTVDGMNKSHFPFALPILVVADRKKCHRDNVKKVELQKKANE